MEVVDRPSFGVNPCTIPKGGWLIESGYDNMRGENATVQYPQMQARVAMTSRLELNLTLPSNNVTSAMAGLDAFVVGVKYGLARSEVQVAAFAALAFPVGSFGAAGASSGITASTDLGNRAGGEATIAYDAHARALLGAVEASVRLAKTSEGFVEIARTTLAGDTVLVVGDLGIQAALTRGLTVDFEVGRSLSSMRETFFGFGFVFGDVRATRARRR